MEGLLEAGATVIRTQVVDRPAEPGRHLGHIGSLRRAEEHVERSLVEYRGGVEEGEDAPTPVVSHHHGEGGVESAGPDQRRHIVEKGQVTNQGHRRPGRRQGHPEGGGDHPCLLYTSRCV